MISSVKLKGTVTLPERKDALPYPLSLPLSKEAMKSEQLEVRQLFDYEDNGHLRRKKITHHNQKEFASIKEGHYPSIRWNGRSYKEHQLIWLWHFGYVPKIVDHINGDVTDNRIENLRECTHAENMRNSKPRRSKYGLKGVYSSGLKGKPFKSLICVDRKQIHLGVFETPEQAHEAYVSASEKIHKEFSRTE